MKRKSSIVDLPVRAKARKTTSSPPEFITGKVDNMALSSQPDSPPQPEIANDSSSSVRPSSPCYEDSASSSSLSTVKESSSSSMDASEPSSSPTQARASSPSPAESTDSSQSTMKGDQEPDTMATDTVQPTTSSPPPEPSSSTSTTPTPLNTTSISNLEAGMDAPEENSILGIYSVPPRPIVRASTRRTSHRANTLAITLYANSEQVERGYISQFNFGTAIAWVIEDHGLVAKDHPWFKLTLRNPPPNLDSAHHCIVIKDEYREAYWRMREMTDWALLAGRPWSRQAADAGLVFEMVLVEKDEG